VQLKDILKEKRHREVTKGVLFLHDNALAHWSLATQKKLAYLGFHCLNYPPYSLLLACSGYYLLPGLKKQLKVHHFSSNCCQGALAAMTEIFFLEWLAKVKATD